MGRSRVGRTSARPSSAGHRGDGGWIPARAAERRCGRRAARIAEQLPDPALQPLEHAGFVAGGAHVRVHDEGRDGREIEGRRQRRALAGLRVGIAVGELVRSDVDRRAVGHAGGMDRADAADVEHQLVDVVVAGRGALARGAVGADLHPQPEVADALVHVGVVAIERQVDVAGVGHQHAILDTALHGAGVARLAVGHVDAIAAPGRELAAAVQHVLVDRAVERHLHGSSLRASSTLLTLDQRHALAVRLAVLVLVRLVLAVGAETVDAAEQPEQLVVDARRAVEPVNLVRAGLRRALVAVEVHAVGQLALGQQQRRILDRVGFMQTSSPFGPRRIALK